MADIEEERDSERDSEREEENCTASDDEYDIPLPSSPGSKKKARAYSKFRLMMYKAARYMAHKQLRYGTKQRSRDYFVPTGEGDPFDDFDPAHTGGLDTFENPCMDIVNLVTSLSGTPDVTGLSSNELERRRKLAEDLMYVDDTFDLEEEEEVREKEEMEQEMEESDVVREVPTSIIYQVPVMSYKSAYKKKENTSIESKEDCTTQLELPRHTKLCIERIVTNHLHKWKTEGKLKDMKEEDLKELFERLTINAQDFLTSKIERKIVKMDSSSS